MVSLLSCTPAARENHPNDFLSLGKGYVPDITKV